MSPPLEAFGLIDHFGGFSVERAVEQQAPIPHEADGFDRILARMHHVYTQTGDERLALAHGLEQARDESVALMRGAGGRYRGPSRKAKRRVVGAWDVLIQSGKRDG